MKSDKLMWNDPNYRVIPAPLQTLPNDKRTVPSNTAWVLVKSASFALSTRPAPTCSRQPYWIWHI